MTLIEGIGDEVIQFFSLLVLLLLGIVAWWSTRTSDLRPIRTVLIFERRTQTADSNATRSSLIINQPERDLSEIINGNGENATPTSDQQQRNDGTDSTQKNGDTDSATAVPSPQPETQPAASSNPTTVESFEPELVATLIRENDLSDTTVEDQSRPAPAVATETASSTSDLSEDRDSSSDGTDQEVDNIRIRLKYLNDDQKLVRGKLHELLGDFKKRHFSVELSREKRIRLIFNGQVLQSDEQTLQGYGLYDNCVVHCLVHTQIQPSGRPSPGSAAANQTPQNNGAPSPPEWNLGGVLYVSLSILLAFAWFFRYHYAQLFTLTTTTALTGLTAMFAVSVVGMYMPDQEAPPA